MTGRVIDLGSVAAGTDLSARLAILRLRNAAPRPL